MYIIEKQDLVVREATCHIRDLYEKIKYKEKYLNIITKRAS